MEMILTDWCEIDLLGLVIECLLALHLHLLSLVIDIMYQNQM